jgi:cytochrome b561
MSSTKNSYGFMSRALHWGMGLAVFAMIALGTWMTDLPNGAQKGQVYMLHKSIGFTLLGVFLWRLYWRLTTVMPQLPETLALWQKRAARLNHFILYVYMGGMLLTGTFMSLLGRGIDWFSLGTISLPYKNPEVTDTLHSLHMTLTDYMWVFLALHVGVAFYHHWVLKDRILMRMVTGR